MDTEIIFKEVDCGFYMGVYESDEESLKEYIIGDNIEERFCICHPEDSLNEIPSGMFDTYIIIYTNPRQMKFLGSFSTFQLAEKRLTNLYKNGINFSNADAVESEYYNFDYSNKKQSIYIR